MSNPHLQEFGSLPTIIHHVLLSSIFFFFFFYKILNSETFSLCPNVSFIKHLKCRALLVKVKLGLYLINSSVWRGAQYSAEPVLTAELTGFGAVLSVTTV